MATARQIQETVARCVSSMVFYVNSGKTRQAKGAIVAEIRAAVDIVSQWALTSPTTNDSFLHQIDVEMLRR
jgi:hypothetical protein